MSPEELAGRVARLEANVTAMQSDLEKLAQQPIETARLSERVSGMEGMMSRLEMKFDRRLDEIEKLIEHETRERQRIAEAERIEAKQMTERRQNEASNERRWRIGLLVVIALGVISSVLTTITVVTG